MILARAVPLVVLGFLIAMSSMIGTQLLNGSINTRHLLWGRRSDGTMYFSPERVQLLLFTIWIALSYLLDVLDNVEHSKYTLPEVSDRSIYLLTGSHAVYLGGKAMAMFRKP